MRRMLNWKKRCTAWSAIYAWVIHCNWSVQVNVHHVLLMNGLVHVLLVGWWLFSTENKDTWTNWLTARQTKDGQTFRDGQIQCTCLSLDCSSSRPIAIWTMGVLSAPQLKAVLRWLSLEPCISTHPLQPTLCLQSSSAAWSVSRSFLINNVISLSILSVEAWYKQSKATTPITTTSVTVIMTTTTTTKMKMMIVKW